MHNGFLGVFNPRGELEAVEASPDVAGMMAVTMSPDKKHPNRVVETVTVVRGDLADLIAGNPEVIDHCIAVVRQTMKQRKQEQISKDAVAHAATLRARLNGENH